MIKKIAKELYGKTPASFTIPCPLADAAKILSEESKRIGILSSGSVVGKSSINKVVLSVSHSIAMNSFTPYFYGRFIREEGQTILTGHFALRPFTQFFMTMWFGGAMLFAVIFLGIGWREGTPQGFVAGIIFMFLCVCFMALGYGFVRLCKKLNDGNIQKIKDHILKSYTE